MDCALVKLTTVWTRRLGLRTTTTSASLFGVMASCLIEHKCRVEFRRPPITLHFTFLVHLFVICPSRSHRRHQEKLDSKFESHVYCFLSSLRNFMMESRLSSKCYGANSQSDHHQPHQLRCTKSTPFLVFPLSAEMTTLPSFLVPYRLWN